MGYKYAIGFADLEVKLSLNRVRCDELEAPFEQVRGFNEKAVAVAVEAVFGYVWVEEIVPTVGVEAAVI